MTMNYWKSETTLKKSIKQTIKYVHKLTLIKADALKKGKIKNYLNLEKLPKVSSKVTQQHERYYNDKIWKVTLSNSKRVIMIKEWNDKIAK